MTDKAVLHYDGREIPLDVVPATEGSPGIDIGKLKLDHGLVTYDVGFANTAPTKSTITYVDGGKGELLYRGYAIEDIAERCTFLEVAYLLIYGELPTTAELDRWNDRVRRHTLVKEEMRGFFDAFPTGAHPMSILSSATQAISAYYDQYHDPSDPAAINESALRLVAKIPTIAAWAYKKSVGEPYIYPRNDLDYPSNFLQMMFGLPVGDYEVDPVVARALDVLFILHADHEMNCSTSTVRLAGSSRANLFASVAAGISALWGPLHGGANQEVVEMLQRIHDDPDADTKTYIERAKDKDNEFRLMGFGHRVYKNYDPRARILREYTSDVLDRLGSDDPLLEIAKELEDAALNDDYFIERKLYPNVDFYSGIIFRALGFPVRMFTVLFAIGRLPGWVAHWKEMHLDPTTRIGRPRQIYVGEKQRPVAPLDQRG
jgi:citrate synthase